MKTILAAILIALSIQTAIPMTHPPTQLQANVQHDINCLAENVYYEARGEPEDGQIAVADVTLNRTEANGFPKTVCGVVHEKREHKCQFSWVCWQKRPPIDKNSQQWEKAQSFATTVLLFRSGKDIMQKQSALFYHADYVHPVWAKKMKLVKKIGKHVFYTKTTKA
jgi:spore germination cell wall hydrolase CwlJ-like protein